MTTEYNVTFEKNLEWVKRVVNSCETQEHLETSEKLVNNFTKGLLNSKDLSLYTKAERELRRILTEKKFKLCKH
jgi:hypothetical protein